MPIDTSIYSIPLNTPDPLSGLQKVAALKGAQQQQLIGAEQLKGARIENQERLQSIDDDDAAKKLFARAQAGGTMPGDAEIIGTVGPKHGTTIVKAMRDAQTANVTLKKLQAEVNEKDADFAGSVAAMVRDQGYSPAALQFGIQQFHNAGYEPQAQQLQEFLLPENRDKIKPLVDGFISKSNAQQKLTNERQTSQARADQAANSKRETDAKLPGIKAQGLTHQLDLAGRAIEQVSDQAGYDAFLKDLDPDVAKRLPAQFSGAVKDSIRRMAVPTKDQPQFDIDTAKAKMGLVGNSEYDQFLVQYARSLGKTPADLSAPEGMASFAKFAELKQDPVMRSLAISQKQLAETMSRAQLAQMPSDQDYTTLAKSLIDKSLSPTQFNELKAGRMGQVSPSKVFLRAKQIDPNFSLGKAESEFKAYEKTEADFTSGKEAGLIRSNNNAIEHLELLDKARTALKNGDIPLLNSLANSFGTATGSSAATTYDHIAARVGDEVQKAFIPGGGSAAERTAAGSGSYNSKMGDAQNAANIRADIALMDSQQRHLNDQYKRGTYNQGGQQLFTPEAMAARDRILSGGRAAPAAGGGSYAATATGKDGHKIGTNDGGKTWFDVQSGKKI